MSFKEKDADHRRAEALLRWQENLDEKINKTLFWLLILTVFYVYYGLVSPEITRGRIERMKSSIEALDTITAQFNGLSARYSFFVSPPPNAPPQSASDIGLFIDKLIPAIRSQQLTEREQIRLNTLDEDMKTLSALYNDHLRIHLLAPITADAEPNDLLKTHLHNFRRALGTIITAESTGNKQSANPVKIDSDQDNQLLDEEAALSLQRSLTGGNSHLIIPNDPVYDLESLAKLEKVINNLNALANDNEDYTLADKARQALFSAEQGGEIRIGDTVTRSLPAYQDLARYTALNDEKFKKNPQGIGTSSYVEITSLLNPPFKVTTVADLSRLKAFADAESDRLSAEYNAPNLKIPFTEATIDRDIVLAAGPFLMVFLLHLLSSYLKRGRRLAEEIYTDGGSGLHDTDYYRLGPHNILRISITSFPHTPADQSGGAWERFAMLLSLIIQFILIRVTPILVPASIIATLLYDLINTHRHSGRLQLILWPVLALSVVLMTTETYLTLNILSSPLGIPTTQPLASPPAAKTRKVRK